MRRNLFLNNFLLLCLLVLPYPIGLENIHPMVRDEFSEMGMESMMIKSKVVGINFEGNERELLQSDSSILTGYKESASPVKLQTLIDGLVFPVRSARFVRKTVRGPYDVSSCGSVSPCFPYVAFCRRTRAGITEQSNRGG